MTGAATTLQAVLAAPHGLTRGWLTITDELITDIGYGEPPAHHVIDLGQHVLAPGFIDVHVHGGDGGQAAGSDPSTVADAVRRAARFHAGHGTTRMVVATVSDSRERLLATVTGIKLAMDRPAPNSASVAGVHLEGPWLSPHRRGAHAAETLRHPDLDEFDSLMDACQGSIRVMTIAPELPGAERVIAAAANRGVVVSVGHTEATYEQARHAFEIGARHLTHLGNAMPPVDRRAPGPIGAALTDQSVTVELIADGEHVHPAMLKLVEQAAPGRVVAITDAIAATGLPDGNYHLGELAVTVTCGRAVLADTPQTLAGSVLTMDRAVGKLIESGIPESAAITAATSTPARVLGEDDIRGRLQVGCRADLVVLRQDWSACATVIDGRVAHDPTELLTL